MRAWSFLRADDLDGSGPFLERLSLVLGGLDLPCILGVIPLTLSQQGPKVVRALAECTRGPLWVAQHGSDHRNRGLSGRKDELGAGACDSEHLVRLCEGRSRLITQFGNRFIDVYIPPWNARTPHTEALASAAGLRSISGWWGRGGESALDVRTDVQQCYRPPLLLAEKELATALAAHPGGGVMLHPALWSHEEAQRLAAALRQARATGTLRPPTRAELCLTFNSNLQLARLQELEP